MNITTRAQDFDMSSAIDQFARDQVRTVLGRLSDHIVAVDVFMKDLNGPKGGIDKQALIRVRLRNRHVLALETEHENLYAAIRKCAKRTKRAVRRYMRKSRYIQKQRIRDRLIDSDVGTVT